jgi:hypothetical protein
LVWVDCCVRIILIRTERLHSCHVVACMHPEGELFHVWWAITLSGLHDKGCVVQRRLRTHQRTRCHSEPGRCFGRRSPVLNGYRNKCEFSVGLNRHVGAA